MPEISEVVEDDKKEQTKVVEKEETKVKKQKISYVEIAVYNGDPYMLENAIKKGEDINSRDGAGKLPIEVAIENNHIDVVKVLIKNGAKLEGVEVGKDTVPEIVELVEEAKKEQTMENVDKFSVGKIRNNIDNAKEMVEVSNKVIDNKASKKKELPNELKKTNEQKTLKKEHKDKESIKGFDEM